MFDKLRNQAREALAPAERRIENLTMGVWVLVVAVLLLGMAVLANAH